MTIAIDDHGFCLSVMQAGCAKGADRADVLIEVEIPGDQRKIVLGRGRGFDEVFAQFLGNLCRLRAS